MKREDLEKLSDREIEKLVAVSSGYNADYIERNPDNTPKYLSDFNLMMPLVFDNKISLEFIDGFGWTADDCYVLPAVSCYDKPLRAAAIVYLLMQDNA